MKAFGAKTPRLLPNAVDTAPDAPAGAKRDEQLAQRKDQLEEQAETLAADLNLEGVDMTALEADVEILSRMDGLKVTDARPERAYCWVQSMYPKDTPGLEIQKKQIQGWKVVKGDPDEGGDIEARAYIGPDGIRRLGDCILMWMPKVRKQALDDQRALQNIRRQGQDVDELKRQVEKETAGALKIVSIGEMSKDQLDRLERVATAKKIGDKKLDQMVRAGTMPGTRLSTANGSTR